MGADLVVVPSPGFDLRSGIAQAQEPAAVEPFVAKATEQASLSNALSLGQAVYRVLTRGERADQGLKRRSWAGHGPAFEDQNDWPERIWIDAWSCRV